MVIDNVARPHPSGDGKQGGQCISIGDDNIPFHFDWWKCYLQIRKLTQEELTSLPVYEPTSPHEYKPRSSFNTRNSLGAHVEVGVEDWQKRLRYPTFETTKAILSARTHMVSILQAESREYLRDYYKTRIWCLRPRRINDTMY